MWNQSDPSVDPVHAIFPFVNLIHPHITLARFFELCDALDPIDRDELIGLAAFELGVEVPDFDDEDARRGMRYQRFKAACYGIGAMDHLILRGVVQEILFIHHYWSDPESADFAISILKTYIEYSKACGETEEELTRWRIMAEEKEVGKKSELQMARRRYELFCNNVVRPLLGIP